MKYIISSLLYYRLLIMQQNIKIQSLKPLIKQLAKIIEHSFHINDISTSSFNIFLVIIIKIIRIKGDIKLMRNLANISAKFPSTQMTCILKALFLR